MRFHYFAFLLIYAASVRPIAQADILFDEPLGNLNMDGTNWNAESSLFDQDQSLNLSTEDNLISLNGDPSDHSLLAEDPTVCSDGYQPLSRIRARMGGYCAQNGEHQDGIVPGDNQLEREAALTQEKINQENCPSDYYQGIFIIPICSLYDSDMIRPSSGENGVPIPETGLQDVWGQLSKWWFFSSTLSNDDI